jgi:hypothetical protein
MYKKNIMTIAAVFLLFAVLLLPSIGGAATTISTSTSNNPTSEIGMTHIQGIITSLRQENNGQYLSFRCVLIHYNTRGVGWHQSGFLHMLQRIIIPGDISGILGNHIIVARFPAPLPI